MANTRQDNPFEVQEIEVIVPNKIRKRMGEAKKKTRKANPWAILAALNPKRYWDMMEKMIGKRKHYRF